MFLPSIATVRLIGVAILVAGLIATGWVTRGWKEDASRLKERDAEITFFAKNSLRWARINSGVSGELGQEKAARETDRRSFEERLRRAKTNQLVQVTCPKQSTVARGEPEATPDSGGSLVGFNAEFARLWNDALGQGASEAERAGGAAAEAAGSGLASITDILANLGENAFRWSECRSQVRGWQSWARQHGFMQ